MTEVAMTISHPFKILSTVIHPKIPELVYCILKEPINTLFGVNDAIDFDVKHNAIIVNSQQDTIHTEILQLILLILNGTCQYTTTPIFYPNKTTMDDEKISANIYPILQHLGTLKDYLYGLFDTVEDEELNVVECTSDDLMVTPHDLEKDIEWCLGKVNRFYPALKTFEQEVLKLMKEDKHDRVV